MPQKYLPSPRFAAMLGALLFSSGLITMASGGTTFFSHASRRAGLAAAQSGVPDLSDANPNWQQQFAGDTVPAQMADIQNQADEITSSLQGKNLTDSVAKSLTVGAFALQGEGLTANADAQNQLVEQAITQVASARPQAPGRPAYLQTDVAASSNTKDDLRAYGNALPKTLAAHPTASEDAALLPVANAVDQDSGAPLASLPGAAREYRVLASAVVKIPTPPIFAPQAAELANDYAAMADALGEMQYLHSDPVRGLLGLQNFEAASQQNAQILLAIGSDLKTSGIVFGSGEPGAAWSQFAAVMAAAQAQQAAQNTTQ